MNGIVMLGVNYTEFHLPPIYFESHYAECYYAECDYAECDYVECDYAECHYAECHYAECHYAECDYAECHYAECHYAECHYAESRFAECLGTVESSTNVFPGHECTTNKKMYFFNFYSFPIFFSFQLKRPTCGFSSSSKASAQEKIL